MNRREALKVLRGATMACWWPSPINPGAADIDGVLTEARGLVHDSLARTAFYGTEETEWRNNLVEAIRQVSGFREGCQCKLSPCAPRVGAERSTS